MKQLSLGTMKLSLPKLIVSLLMVYCILFPADKLNIKEILLITALMICSPAIIKTLKNKENIFIWIYGILFPVFTIMTSIIVWNTKFYDAFSYGYVWTFFLLIPPIKQYDIDIKKPFIFATILIALMIDFVFLADKLNLISIFSNPIIVFFDNMNELQYGKGSLATFGYSIFFKGSPLILFTYGYYLYNKKFCLSIVLLLSIMACGTRASFVAALCVTAIIPILSTKTFSKKTITIIIVLVITAFIFPYISNKLTELTLLKYDSSDSVKISQIKYIFSWMNSRPLSYLIGTGVGSFFYNGMFGYTNVVESSYFDYFRQVGIIGMSFLLYFLIKPIREYKKDEYWVVVTYIGYLAVAFTNPLLVTSTAFMAYLEIYAHGFSKKELYDKTNKIIN